MRPSGFTSLSSLCSKPSRISSSTISYFSMSPFLLFNLEFMFVDSYLLFYEKFPILSIILKTFIHHHLLLFLEYLLFTML